MPSGKCYRSIATCATHFRDVFFPIPTSHQGNEQLLINNQSCWTCTLHWTFALQTHFHNSHFEHWYSSLLHYLHINFIMMSGLLLLLFLFYLLGHLSLLSPPSFCNCRLKISQFLHMWLSRTWEKGIRLLLPFLSFYLLFSFTEYKNNNKYCSVMIIALGDTDWES